MTSNDNIWVVLATGGTIAGVAKDVAVPGHYASAQVGGQDLFEQWGISASRPCVFEQVAQIDSKDMSEAIWRQLLARVTHWQAQPEVAGVVITHGTDTLEETAFLLHWLLPPGPPVVITGAMLPSNAPQSDGAHNLQLAFDWLASGQAQGVSVAFAGHIHHPEVVTKSHADQLDAFSTGSWPTWAQRVNGQWEVQSPQPDARGHWPRPALTEALATPTWPRVEVFLHHAAANPEGWLSLVQAAQPPLAGLVLAGTGHGTTNEAWHHALMAMQQQGVQVAVSSRCAFSTVKPYEPQPGWLYSGHLNAVKTRLALQMACLDQALKA
jgi:L-asparaginase